MNSVDSSTVVYSRLSSLDPESASKTMGFILIHGPNEDDMKTLANAPDALLQQLISKGKSYSNILTSSASALHSSVSDALSQTSGSAGSPRFARNGSSPRGSLNKVSPSYASVVNGNSSNSAVEVGENVEEYGGGQDGLSFLNEQAKSDDLCDMGLMMHKRSLSVSDASRAGEMNGGGGFGWRSSSAATGGGASSPGRLDAFEHGMLCSRAATQQQRQALASQIMSGHSFPYNKYFTDSPRSMAAAMMVREELQKMSQLRHDLSDIAFMGSNSSARQIYLTFPADSTFREEDVSNYFSLYGPVQDVRIPYQQKRMFGFVTFVHPETVKIILAKGNPHFVCDSRVLVKPYKEKGKVEKKHLMTPQQLERGDLSCLSPRGVDIRDFDVRVGPRMFYNNTQDLLIRRKLEEQAEFQKALELQSRKMANLKLLELNNLPRHHPFSPGHALSPTAAISSPAHHPPISPYHMRSLGAFNQDAFDENVNAPMLSLPPHVLANRQMSLERYSNVNNRNVYTTNFSENSKVPDSAIANGIDPVLPDTLEETTPTKLVLSSESTFSSVMLGKNDNAATCSSPFSSNNGTIVSSACLSNDALPKSRFLDDPSFGATGSRAIEM